MVLQNYQNFTETASNMIYILAFALGLKCPQKIHMSTKCPPPHFLQVKKEVEVDIFLEYYTPKILGPSGGPEMSWKCTKNLLTLFLGESDLRGSSAANMAEDTIMQTSTMFPK